MKKNNSKPRKFSIKGSFVANSNEITFSLNNGQLVAESANGKVNIENFEIRTLYERNKGDKVLNQIHSGANSIDINKSLSQYDVLYAVDTNTKELDGKFISIAAVIKGEFLVKDDTGFKLNYSCLSIMTSESIHRMYRTEQYFWYEAIKLIQKEYALFNKMPYIGFIVDCDLGNLGKYNEKQVPIHGNVFLPENIKLIYASSDAGKESLPNLMISLSDKEANNHFQRTYLDKENV